MIRKLLRSNEMQISSNPEQNSLKQILCQLTFILIESILQFTQYAINTEYNVKMLLILICLYGISIIALLILSQFRTKLLQHSYLLIDAVSLFYFIIQIYGCELNTKEINLMMFSIILSLQYTFVFKLLTYILILIKLILFSQEELLSQLILISLVTLLAVKSFFRLYFQIRANSKHTKLLTSNHFYQSIMDIFEQDSHIGILIPDDRFHQFQQQFSSDSFLTKDSRSIKRTEFEKIPIIVHQNMVYQTASLNPKEKCIKQQYDNLYHFLDYFDELLTNHGVRIYAKEKERGIKYKVFIRETEIEGQTIRIVYFINLSEFTGNQKISKEMKKFQQQLISALTHKLKTPLSSALTHLTSAVKDQQVSDTIKQTYITPAFQNCQVQLYQVQDILDFISQDIECQYPQIKYVDILFITQKVMDIIEQSCNSKQIELKLTLNKNKINPQMQHCFYTDENKLSRILINLLNNAYRFTQQGGQILLDINLNDNCQAIFTVQDSGYGMTSEQFEHISKELQYQPLGRRISQAQVSQKENISCQFMGISLQITNLLVKTLNSVQQPLTLVNSNKNGTKFEFLIESLQDSPCPLALKSQKNIDNFRTHRSISISNQMLPTSAQQKQKLSTFSLNKGSQLLNKSKSFEIFSSLEDISQEPSCQQLLATGNNKVNKKQVKTPTTFRGAPSPAKFIKVSQHRQTKLIRQDTEIVRGIKHVASYSKFEVQSSDVLGNSNGKIIIVDDEPFNHISLTMMLKNLKCNQIESAYNGMECIQKVKEMDGCIRCVLMDVDMPIMDGVQAATKIYQMQQSQMLCIFPIIGCTAHQDELTHQECLDAGMVAVLTKPIFVKQLHEVIKLIETPIESQQRVSYRKLS